MLKGLSHSMDQSNKMYTNFMLGIRENRQNEQEKVFNRRLSDLIKFIVDNINISSPHIIISICLFDTLLHSVQHYCVSMTSFILMNSDQCYDHIYICD